MKYFYLLLLITTFCQAQNTEAEINKMLDSWHTAASKANFTDYFDLMAGDAVFIGTDATENWNKDEFMAYAKPYFDKGKAWSFTALERNIYFDHDQKIAWFDELLNTQMKICRGSGVVVKIDGKWKIQHYVLSMTVPNNNANEVIKIKTKEEDTLIKELENK